MNIVRMTLTSIILLVIANQQSYAENNAWIPLFDGKSLAGWKKLGGDDSFWAVEEGAICGTGTYSMLMNTQGPYKNFRIRAEININEGGNSGLYFRASEKSNYADGYEAQINSTNVDPIRTGSLYGLAHIYKQLIEPGTWFNYELEVKDDVWRGRKMTRIKVMVNGEELYEYYDFGLSFKDGYFAFQQHHPGSKVCIRNTEVLPLGD